VFIGATIPVVMQTPRNPDGTPAAFFDGLRERVLTDRGQHFKGMIDLHFSVNREWSTAQQSDLDQNWTMTMLSGFPASYFGIAAFAETDVTEDLKMIDVPTLILHGDDDQIAPVANAYIAAKLVPLAAFLSSSRSSLGCGRWQLPGLQGGEYPSDGIVWDQCREVGVYGIAFDEL
jgi:non-heme chloroperoxidase